MNERQKSRIELEDEIWIAIQEGWTDEEIVLAYNTNVRRIQSVRLQHGMTKKAKNLPKDYSSITDSLVRFHEETDMEGVPVVIKGKRYIDITGCVVDCGSAYK